MCLVEGPFSLSLLICTWSWESVSCHHKNISAKLTQRKEFPLILQIRSAFLSRWTIRHAQHKAVTQIKTRTHHNLWRSRSLFAVGFFPFWVALIGPPLQISKRDLQWRQLGGADVVEQLNEMSLPPLSHALRLCGCWGKDGTDRSTEWQTRHKYAIMKLVKYLMTSFFHHLLADRWVLPLWEIRLEVSGWCDRKLLFKSSSSLQLWVYLYKCQSIQQGSTWPATPHITVS